jgi:hypothetical protein
MLSWHFRKEMQTLKSKNCQRVAICKAHWKIIRTWRGHADQFQFAFMTDEPVDQVREEIAQTAMPSKPSESAIIKAVGEVRKKRNLGQPK